MLNDVDMGDMFDLQRTLWLADEDATVAAGRWLGRSFVENVKQGVTVFLSGQLGAGKTTLTRGILRALGHSGAVKSPTYTLVEPYENLSKFAYHFDLYRLGDPEELDYIGIRDYFQGDVVCIVEWPDKGRGFLPEPDIQLELMPATSVEGVLGRSLHIKLLTSGVAGVLAYE